MSVGVLIVTHDGLGASMLDTARRLIGEPRSRVETVAVSFSASPEHAGNELAPTAERLDDGEGVLILTDLYGATPSNAAHRAAAGRHVRVVSGLSLPMLVRVLNYADEPLDRLAERAATGARNGVVIGGGT